MQINKNTKPSHKFKLETFTFILIVALVEPKANSFLFVKTQKQNKIKHTNKILIKQENLISLKVLKYHDTIMFCYLNSWIRTDITHLSPTDYLKNNIN